jgi:hypothetical protein
MEPLSPVYTAPLFAPLHGELISLLEGLEPHDWARGTLARTSISAACRSAATDIGLSRGERSTATPIWLHFSMN